MLQGQFAKRETDLYRAADAGTVRGGHLRSGQPQQTNSGSEAATEGKDGTMHVLAVTHWAKGNPLVAACLDAGIWRLTFSTTTFEISTRILRFSSDSVHS